MIRIGLILALLCSPVFAQSGQGVGPAISAVGQSGSASDLSSGTLGSARMPAMSGDCTSSAGSVALTCTLKLASTTVASLPTCNAGSKGLMLLVTDALLPAALAIVAGSGAVVVSVVCNGTNFIVQ